MLGAIIGDIVGSRHEFRPTNDYNFTFFHQDCGFTDDTICTIAVADALIKGEPYGKTLHQWCRRYPYAGYGGRFRRWIKSDSPLPYNSFGNGSAMRVSPVGWWFFTADEVLEQAKLSAECSHNHPLGIQGAQAVAIAIHDCLKLRRARKANVITREDILNFGLRRAIELYSPVHSEFNLNIEDYRNIFDETCQGTVPVALAILLDSNGFEDAVRRAVSLGADADTLGAIVGSIAEALWGIPESMKKEVYSALPHEMRSVISEFRHKLNQRRKEAKI